MSVSTFDQILSPMPAKASGYTAHQIKIPSSSDVVDVAEGVSTQNSVGGAVKGVSAQNTENGGAGGVSTQNSGDSLGQGVDLSGSNPSLSYAELYEVMNPRETAEDKARREKKEKREKVFSAIGDGISALSNLFYTTRYAPNMYDYSKGLSTKARDRWERINARKDAENRDWVNGYMRALQLDDAKDKDERAWQNTLERQAKQDEKDAKAEERAAAKAKQDADMAELNMLLMAGKIDAQQWDAEKKKIEAQYAPQLQEAELKRKKAQTNASNASAGASSARADYYRNGGSGSKKDHSSLDLEDGIEEYATKEDYERAVEKWAKEYGIPTVEVQVT